MINLNYKRILLLIFSLLIFGLIIYFIAKQFSSTCSTGFYYNSDRKKCLIKCNAPQINGNDNEGTCQCPDPQTQEGSDCLLKCGDGLDRCGTGCYNIVTQKCINDKSCDIDSVCENNTKCCSDNNDEYCNKDIDKCEKKNPKQQCQPSQTPCGPINCCDSNEKCNQLNNTCCNLDTHDICNDGSCCQKVQDPDGNLVSRCCGDKCCPDNLLCNPLTKTCQVQCKYKDKNKKTIFCDIESQDPNVEGTFCFNHEDINDPSKNYSNCAMNNCQFSEITYTPSYFVDAKNNENKVAICGNTGVYFSTSYPPDKDGAFTPYSTPLLRNATTNPIKGTCNEANCEQRTSEVFLDSLTATYDGKVCKADFDCGPLLTFYNYKNNLEDPANPYSKRKDSIQYDECPFENTLQCCFNSNNNLFTGQVCDSDKIANFNGVLCDCQNFNEYCNNNGTFNMDAKKCNCNTETDKSGNTYRLFGGNQCNIDAKQYCAIKTKDGSDQIIGDILDEYDNTFCNCKGFVVSDLPIKCSTIVQSGNPNFKQDPQNPELCRFNLCPYTDPNNKICKGIEARIDTSKRDNKYYCP